MLFVPAQHPLPLRLTETVGKRNCPSLELGGWNSRGPHPEGLPRENLPREQERAKSSDSISLGPGISHTCDWPHS